MIVENRINPYTEVEIMNFNGYGGTKDLQMKWEKHIGVWKGWV